MPNKTIKSHNSGQFYLVKELFLPSPVHLLLYLLTGVVILATINTARYWEYLNQDPNGRAQSLQLFGSGTDSGGILGSSTTGRVGQMLVWGMVGVIIYVVIWFLKNIITNLRNDVLADEYVHPHSYNRAKYWKSVVYRKAFFILITGVLFGYIYVLVKLLPILRDYFFTMIVDFNAHNGLYGLASIASATLLIHVLINLCRLTISAWRFIYADL